MLGHCKKVKNKTKQNSVNSVGKKKGKKIKER